jgi:Ring finger domain
MSIRYLQQGPGINTNTNTYNNSTSIPGRDPRWPNDGKPQDLVKLLSFMSLYLLLFFCCIVPPWLVYRRQRRQRLQQFRQDSILQFMQMLGEADSDEPVFRDAEDLRKYRLQRIQEILQHTTMVVKSENLIRQEETVSEIDKGIENNHEFHDIEENCRIENSDDPDSAGQLRLGDDLPNGSRQVPALCIICLCRYEIGDSICISNNQMCPHVFHLDCAVTWLSKTKVTLCPCCRQDYCPKVTEELNSVHPLEERDPE